MSGFGIGFYHGAPASGHSMKASEKEGGENPIQLQLRVPLTNGLMPKEP